MAETGWLPMQGFSRCRPVHQFVVGLLAPPLVAGGLHIDKSVHGKMLLTSVRRTLLRTLR